MKNKKITFEQWRSTKVLLPYFLHCQLWGIDTEHEDINRRVLSYSNGFFIDVNNDWPFTKYQVEYGHCQTFESGLLDTVEEHFWSECVNGELNPLNAEEYREALEERVAENFDELFNHAVQLSGIKHGDISPCDDVVVKAQQKAVVNSLVKFIKENL